MLIAKYARWVAYGLEAGMSEPASRGPRLHASISQAMGSKHEYQGLPRSRNYYGRKQGVLEDILALIG